MCFHDWRLGRTVGFAKVNAKPFTSRESTSLGHGCWWARSGVPSTLSGANKQTLSRQRSCFWVHHSQSSDSGCGCRPTGGRPGAEGGAVGPGSGLAPKKKETASLATLPTTDRAPGTRSGTTPSARLSTDLCTSSWLPPETGPFRLPAPLSAAISPKS
jgi:hypothetical protein